jgi:hypothetical protein
MSMGMEKEGKDAAKKRLAEAKAANKTYTPGKGNMKKIASKKLGSLKEFTREGGPRVTSAQIRALGEKGVTKAIEKAEKKMRQSDKMKTDRGARGIGRMAGLGGLRMSGGGTPRVR